MGRDACHRIWISRTMRMRGPDLEIKSECQGLQGWSKKKGQTEVAGHGAMAGE